MNARQIRIFPVVGEQTLRDLVKEWKATGPVFYNTLRDSIRSSYRSHYRQMLPALKALEFRSNNAMYQPIIQALETVKRYADTKLRYNPSDEQVPLDFAHHCGVTKSSNRTPTATSA